MTRDYGSPLFDWSPEGSFHLGERRDKSPVIHLCVCGRPLTGEYAYLGVCEICLEESFREEPPGKDKR